MVLLVEHRRGALEGQLIGKWRVGRLMGGGAFGQVYEAMDEKGLGLGAGALKVLNSHLSEVTTDASNEARHLSRHQHQNLVGYLGSGTHERPDGSQDHFVVMELCERTLKDVLRERRVDEIEAQQILAEIVSGLAYLHGRGVVHRDIKPSNLLFGDGCWKLGDFGISGRLSQIDVNFGGTRGYMAPEVLFDELSYQSDMYSVGVVAYFASTGRMPPRSSDGKLREDSVLDGWWGALVAETLEPDPSNRPTAPQFLDRLASQGRRLTADEPTERRRPEYAEPTRAAAPPTVVGAGGVPPTSADAALPNRRLLSRVAVVLAVAVVVAGASLGARSWLSRSDVESVVGVSPTAVEASPTAVEASPTVVEASPTVDDPSADASPMDSTTSSTSADRNAASKITVALDGSGDFDSLADAVEAADGGATILVAAGEHQLDHQLNVTKALSIIGVGGDESVIVRVGAVSANDGSVLRASGGRLILQDVGISIGDGQAGFGAAVVHVVGGEVDFDGVTVTGGSGNGATLIGVSGAIADSRFSDNELSGLVLDDADVTVSGSVAEANGTAGFIVEGEAAPVLTDNTGSNNADAGFIVRGEVTPDLRGNTATGNTAAGFVWAESAAGQAIGNAADTNGLSGFIVEDKAAPRLVDNVAMSNVQAGFVWLGSASGSASDSVADANGLGGFAVVGSAHPSLTHNKAVSNLQSGFFWTESASGSGRGNLARANGFNGFEVRGGAAPGLTDNMAVENSEHGFIWFEAAAGSASGNESEANVLNGFHIQDEAAPLLTENSAIGNTRYGFLWLNDQGDIAAVNSASSNGVGDFSAG